jgi:hypothetical protein
MSNVVDLQKLRSDNLLIADFARFAEGLFSEVDVRKRHRLPESVWDALGEDDLFVEQVEAEKLRRIRNGASKRERAQALIVEGPAVLGDIMRDPAASPRHRVDAIRTLDHLADNGPESAPARDFFQITINLGGDVLKFGGARTPSKTIEHDDTDTPQELLPVIAAKRNSDPNGGAPW